MERSELVHTYHVTVTRQITMTEKAIIVVKATNEADAIGSALDISSHDLDWKVTGEDTPEGFEVLKIEQAAQAA
jgi:hypothetical protein